MTGPNQPAAEPAGTDRAGSGRPIPKPSGLKNPIKAIRGAAAATLILEALVVLLALRPIAQIGGGLSAGRLTLLIGLAVALLLVTGALRAGWGWWLATALVVAVVVCGVLTSAMYVVGGFFALIWLFLVRLRRSMLADEAARAAR